VLEVALLGYLGPGAGLSMIGALLAVACMILLALVAPVVYPIRAFLAWRRRRKQSANGAIVAPSQSGEGAHGAC
jgi:hypothetical protein